MTKNVKIKSFSSYFGFLAVTKRYNVVYMLRNKKWKC
ncbi:MAG: hypothetical protein RL757_3210 [Bacteroidota bacterium]|jgi:hypothetical protein